MFHSTSLLARVAVLVTLLACAATQPANAVVGTQTLDFSDAARGRKLTSELWFSAAPGTRAESFSVLLPITAIEIARNAVPDVSLRTRPLIVVSHGNWGTRYSQGWLIRELVNAGYVVLSVSHPGTLNDDQTLAGRTRLWDRSRDVTVVLNALLADDKWRPLIDAQRIGFVGHSFGGFTGLSLAGARFDLVQQHAACDAMKVKDMYCQALLTEDYASVSRVGMADSYLDARIKSFYLMATGPSQGFSAESLLGIKASIFLDTARFDTVLEPVSNSTAMAKRIPKAIEVLRDVSHFTYVPLCKPGIGKLVAPLICTDQDGVDRAGTHSVVARSAIAFFANTLQ